MYATIWVEHSDASPLSNEKMDTTVVAAKENESNSN